MDPTQSTSSTPPGIELGGQSAGGAAAGGYEICINVAGDQITVGVGDGQQPAADIGAALATALQIYKAGGQMPDAQGESASMHAGFNKVKQVGM